MKDTGRDRYKELSDACDQLGFRAEHAGLGRREFSYRVSRQPTINILTGLKWLKYTANSAISADGRILAVVSNTVPAQWRPHFALNAILLKEEGDEEGSNRPELERRVMTYVPKHEKPGYALIRRIYLDDLETFGRQNPERFNLSTEQLKNISLTRRMFERIMRYYNPVSYRRQ